MKIKLSKRGLAALRIFLLVSLFCIVFVVAAENVSDNITLSNDTVVGNSTPDNSSFLNVSLQNETLLGDSLNESNLTREVLRDDSEYGSLDKDSNIVDVVKTKEKPLGEVVVEVYNDKRYLSSVKLEEGKEIMSKPIRGAAYKFSKKDDLVIQAKYVATGYCDYDLKEQIRHCEVPFEIDTQNISSEKFEEIKVNLIGLEKYSPKIYYSQKYKEKVEVVEYNLWECVNEFGDREIIDSEEIALEEECKDVSYVEEYVKNEYVDYKEFDDSNKLSDSKSVSFLAIFDMPLEDSVKFDIEIEAKNSGKITKGVLDPVIGISDCDDLNNIRFDMTADYILTQNIDCSETRNWSDGAGWYGPWSFNGTFDGQGYAIENLYINRPDSNYEGFFASVSGGKVSNLNFINASVTGHSYNGILAATISSGAIIENCSTHGTLTLKDYFSTDSKSGGFVGRTSTSAIIRNSYSDVDVMAYNRMQVGTFVGYHRGRDNDPMNLIENSYAIGTLTGTGHKQGNFVGDNDGGNITNCYSVGENEALLGYKYGTPVTANSYWDSNVSGVTSSTYGGEAKTTEELMTESTFVGWDFNNVWEIEENISYPHLRWEHFFDPVFIKIVEQEKIYSASPEFLIYVRSDNLSECWYSINNNLNISISNCNSTNYVVLQGLEKGLNNLVVWANTTSGEVRSSSTTFEFVDVWFDLFWPIEGAYLAVGEFLFNLYNYTDPIDTCLYSIDSSENVSMDCNGLNLSLAEGTHNLKIYGNDTEGGEDSREINFYVDSSYPYVNINGTVTDNYFLSSFSDKNLSRWWRFDEKVMNNFSEFNGNLDAVNYGSKQRSGIFGKALDFEGEHYLNTQYEPVFSAGDEFSVSLWSKTNSEIILGVGTMFGAISNVSSGQEWIAIDSRGDCGGGIGQVGFVVRDSAGNLDYICSEDKYNDLGWHHMVGTYRQGNMTFYIDGEVQGSINTTSDGVKNFTGYPFYVGGVNNLGTSDFFFDGMVDDVIIFNRVLSHQEVLRLYPNVSSDTLAFDNKIIVQDRAGNVNYRINDSCVSPYRGDWVLFEGEDCVFNSPEDVHEDWVIDSDVVINSSITVGGSIYWGSNNNSLTVYGGSEMRGV